MYLALHDSNLCGTDPHVDLDCWLFRHQHVLLPIHQSCSAYHHCIIATCVLSPQVRPRVWRRWYEPGLGGLQSSVAVLPPLLQEPPPQTCSHCTWWSGFVWVTMFPSSSNSECTHHVCIPTTRVSPLVPDLQYVLSLLLSNYTMHSKYTVAIAVIQHGWTFEPFGSHFESWCNLIFCPADLLGVICLHTTPQCSLYIPQCIIWGKDKGEFNLKTRTWKLRISLIISEEILCNKVTLS